MMPPDDLTRPVFSAVREIRSRRSTEGAIFQVVLHLTMGFIVIAGLRPTEADEKKLEAVRLWQELQAERSRVRESVHLVAEIVGAYGAQDLPRTLVLEQVAQAAKRL